MSQGQIPLEWINWIKENLNNGCDAGALAGIMAGKGFSSSIAFQAINDIKNGNPVKIYAPSLATSTANDYNYEKPRVAIDANYVDTSDRRVYFGTKVAQPVIVVFDNFMSHEECDELIALSRGQMKASRVVDNETGAETLHDERTSFGTFFTFHANPLISKLDRRAAEAMNWPEENGEGIQILNYKPGAEYTAHFDFFPYEVKGSQKHLAIGGQRVSTLVMYLNDVEEGGETAFPELGIRVVPKKGSAVYFEYCNSDGQVDRLSLHAGLPVIRGEKWIATKWMRQKKYS